MTKRLNHKLCIGCHSTLLRRRALREEISLADLISLGRAQELSDKQASVINSNTYQESACKIKTSLKGQTNKTVFQPKQTSRNCRGTYPHNDRPCPAKGKSCNLCKKTKSLR